MARPATPAPCAGKSYHVDWDPTGDRWDVHDEDGQVIGHRHDRDEAIAFAITEAQHAHGRGETAAVCVEQKDGRYTLAWSA